MTLKALGNGGVMKILTGFCVNTFQTDLNPHRREEFGAVAYTLNSRPYKTLGWKTPAKAPDEILA